MIIPLFNAEKYIAESIHSILQQTLLPQEIIVVDDGSSDGSVAAIPSDPHITVLRCPHRGISPTIEEGIQAATGEFLAFLDADDRWLPDKLALQYAALQQDPSLGMVFGAARVFHEPQPDSNIPLPPPSILPKGVSKSALFIRRSTMKAVGPYALEGAAHDFLDWYARATDQGVTTLVLPELLYERRVHDANDGITNKERQRRNYFATLRRTLDRRRAGQAFSTEKNAPDQRNGPQQPPRP